MYGVALTGVCTDEHGVPRMLDFNTVVEKPSLDRYKPYVIDDGFGINDKNISGFEL